MIGPLRRGVLRAHTLKKICRSVVAVAAELEPGIEGSMECASHLETVGQTAVEAWVKGLRCSSAGTVHSCWHA